MGEGGGHIGDPDRFWRSLEEIAAELPGRADEIEAAGEVPGDVVERLSALGAMHICVPTEYGGLGWGPVEWFRLVRTLAHGDASTGWVFSQPALITAQLATAGSPALQKAVADPRFIVAASVAGRVRAHRTTDGYAVENARWAFESGCTHATMIGGVIVVPGDDPPAKVLNALAPAEEFEIVKTWSARGLQGTASHDAVLGAYCFAPEWTVPFPPAGGETPIGRIGIGAWPASVSCAGVQLGIAAAALESALDQARAKRRPGERAFAVEQGWFHVRWAEARGRFDAATAAVDVALADAWAHACAGSDITLEHRGRLRFASAHAVREAATIVRICADLVGADSVYRKNRMERLFRDSHVLTHHVSVADHTMETVSRVINGIQPDDGFT